MAAPPSQTTPTDTGSTVSTTSSSSTTSSTSSTSSSTSSSSTSSTSSTSSSSTSSTSSSSTTSSTSSTLPSSTSSSSSSSTSSSFTSSTLSTFTGPSTASSHTFVISGSTVTIVTFVPADTGTPSGDTQQNNSTSKPFFKNTGAVAGVFTVVGLLALALVIALATNAVRRRRARKFDEDVAAAAAEAAATPRYPFEYDDDPTPGGGYRGGAYSDQESHGTFNQPPMSHGGHGESYHMADFPAYGPGLGAPALRNRKDSAATDLSGPGIAGFGSSGAALRRNPSGPAPYPAYVGPGEMYDAHGQAPPRQDPRDAAGLAGPAAAGGAYLNRSATATTAPSAYSQTSLGRQAARGLSPEHPPGMPMPGPPSSHGHESYAAHYQQDFNQQDGMGPTPPQYSAEAGGSAGPGLPNPFAAMPDEKHYTGQGRSSHEEAYGDDDAYAPESYMPPRALDDSRMSFRDEDDYALDSGRRVLKVANE